MRLQRFAPKKARIEIIPMIDVVFFLLVFFMIASLAMTTMKGMPVNLPKSSSAKDRPMVKVVLSLTASNHYYIDKRQVAFGQIYPRSKRGSWRTRSWLWSSTATSSRNGSAGYSWPTKPNAPARSF